MLYTRIPLGKDKDSVPYITTYILDNVIENQPVRPLIVIFPGGGYGFCSPREAEPIATAFNAAGMNAIVVKYEVSTPYPASLITASNAVVYAREHAQEWNCDPNQIFVCGFSAGAHLAANISTMWNKEPAIKRNDEKNKPNGSILAYPVITSGEYAHRGSFDNINATTPELLELTSLEKQVDSDTPKTFIWHTFDDAAVPLENSLLYASSLRKNNIPFEYHVYHKGSHGLSLATDFVCNDMAGATPHTAGWINLATEWVNEVK